MNYLNSFEMTTQPNYHPPQSEFIKIALKKDIIKTAFS